MTDVTRTLQQAVMHSLTHAKRIIVAYSGGVDSHVLLHVAQACCRALKISCLAIHINHQLSALASHWATHCGQVCNALNVPMELVAVDCGIKTGDSIESRARAARYDAFEQVLKHGDVLLFAHHMQDQAETFLLQALRGAGPKGLSAMPDEKKMGAGLIRRPFLNCEKQMILDYAKQYTLKWIEDDSNRDQSLRRNFLRQTIMPQLREHWPALDQTLSRAAKHCGSAVQQVAQHIQPVYAHCHDASDNTLKIESLKRLGFDTALGVLRYWVSDNNTILPSEKKSRQMLMNVLEAAPDKNPTVHFGENTVFRYRNKLYLTNRQGDLDYSARVWHLSDKILHLPGGLGKLICRKAPEGVETLVVRFLCVGERLTLNSKLGRQSLKKLWQQWGVAPIFRQRIPKIYHQNQLICIPNFGVDYVYGQLGLSIEWETAHAISAAESFTF